MTDNKVSSKFIMTVAVVVVATMLPATASAGWFTDAVKNVVDTTVAVVETTVAVVKTTVDVVVTTATVSKELVDTTAALGTSVVTVVVPRAPDTFIDAQSSFVINNQDAAQRGVSYHDIYIHGTDHGFRDIGHRGARWRIMQNASYPSECVVLHGGAGEGDSNSNTLDIVSSQLALTWKKNGVWMNNAFKVSYDDFSTELNRAMSAARDNSGCYTWDIWGYSLGGVTGNIHANDVSGEFNIRDVHAVASLRTFRESSPKKDELCQDSLLYSCPRVSSCENFKNNISGLAIRYNRMNLDGSEYDMAGVLPAGWHHCADYHVGLRSNSATDTDVEWGYSSIDIGADYPDDALINVPAGLMLLDDSEWHSISLAKKVLEKAIVDHYGDYQVGGTSSP